jgi:hypothetical protein
MGIFNAFVAYKFIKILSMPWEDTDAFKFGIIDKDGKVLKKMKDLRTSEERKSYTIFHRLIWNLKKVLEKVSIFKSRIASFAAALYLIKEQADPEGTTGTLIEDMFLDFLKENGCDVDSMMLNESFEMRDGTIKRGLYVIEGKKIFIEENIKAFDEILGIPLFKIDFLGEEKVITKEDAIANVAGSGENIAGLDGKPPVSKKPKVQRRAGITGGIKEAKEYEPEKRRKLKTGEVEVMKGKGNRQKWFYLKNEEDVKQLIRLGRNSAFPTGITNNNSRVKFDKDWHIKESVEENMQTGPPATSKDETPATFAGARIFKVSSEEYCNCLQGRKKHERWKRKLNMDDIENQSIRSYAHKNPGKSIILQDANTGEMSYLLR